MGAFDLTNRLHPRLPLSGSSSANSCVEVCIKPLGVWMGGFGFDQVGRGGGWRSDLRHEKTDLKVFVVVIPKEGWARVATPVPLLV